MINRNMGCIEIAGLRLTYTVFSRLIETWDVLKSKTKRYDIDVYEINRNMGCIEIKGTSAEAFRTTGLIETWDVLK